MPEPLPPAPVAPARRTLALTALALGFALALGAAGSAAGQEGEPAPDGQAPTATSSTTAPPSTVLLPDGDVGVLPPGASPPGAPPLPGEPPPEGQPPAEGEVPVPEELAVVVLPDPTPGLNAALAAIDVSASERLVADTARPVAGARERTAVARMDLQEAVQVRRDAEARVASAKAGIDALAVNALMYGDPAGLDPFGAPQTVAELRDVVLHDTVAEHVRTTFDVALADLQGAVAAEASAAATLTAAQRHELVVERGHVLARVELERAMARAAEARSQVGPAILGQSVLDPGDLVAWYRTYYPLDPPVAPITDIIDAYLRVGAEEGVTGDIAFAQAILETGGFRSGHAQDYNFAGIGAYDHCAPACGSRFADLDDGVRAHLHLLRGYADPQLRSDQLAELPNPLVAPERLGVRGCCPRWAALTGVWASDDQYDRKVLGIYRLMVETARSIDGRVQQ